MHWKYEVTPEAVATLLTGGGEFVRPEKILLDLTEAQARTIPVNSPYCIAQIVYHLHYWQQATLRKAEGVSGIRPAHLSDTFAMPLPGEWDSLRRDFLTGIEDVKRLAREKGATDSPENPETALGYDLAESALHNAYHLGQIVMVRHLLGMWPPAGGDDNDF